MPTATQVETKDSGASLEGERSGIPAGVMLVSLPVWVIYRTG